MSFFASQVFLNYVSFFSSHIFFLTLLTFLLMITKIFWMDTNILSDKYIKFLWVISWLLIYNFFQKCVYLFLIRSDLFSLQFWHFQV